MVEVIGFLIVGMIAVVVGMMVLAGLLFLVGAIVYPLAAIFAVLFGDQE